MKNFRSIFRPEGCPRNPRYRPDIDGLRAIAILSVLAFHAWPQKFRGGFVGVDVFFVISGYLITGIITGNIDSATFKFRDFYGRRIRRIFPSLILVLAVTILLGWFVLFPREFRDLGWHVINAGVFSSNLKLWSETGYFDPGSETKPLLHLWSLGIEEQFYLFWPVLLLGLTKTRLSRFWTIAALGVASFALNMGLYKFYPSAAFYMPFTRMWELLIGALLSESEGRFAPVHQCMPKAIRTRWRDGASAIGLLCIFVSVLHSAPGVRAVLPTVGAALAIAAGPGAWLNRHLLANRPAVYIGLISYPLYLWHWPLISFIHVMEIDSQAKVRLFIALSLAVSFLLAAATYHILDRPIRHAALRRVVPWSIGGMLLAMAAGACLVLGNGMYWRFTPQVRSMISYVDAEQDLRNTVFRERSCFLDLDQDENGFAPVCGVPAPAVFLWGDSHAAHLYSGIAAAIPRVSQYTSTECPPLLGFRTISVTNGHCPAINRRVMADLVRAHPHVVILAAYWPLYAHEPRFAEALGATIAGLKSHTDLILLVGPVPAFPKPQLRMATRLSGSYMLRDDNLNDIIFADALLRSFADSQDVRYVSPVSQLCKDGTCKVIVPDTSDKLFAFDYGHLTRAGSAYYYRKFIAPALHGY